MVWRLAAMLAAVLAILLWILILAWWGLLT